MAGNSGRQSRACFSFCRTSSSSAIAAAAVALRNEYLMASPADIPLLVRVMTKRRTWICLFLLFYTLLLYCCWCLLLATHSWYNAAASFSSSWWPTLYASVLYGGLFGLLSMGVALPVAVPATLVTWSTVLVLLAFAGKPWRALVMDGRRITADISAVALKILVRESNLVTGVCAGLSFVALLLSSRRGEHDL